MREGEINKKIPCQSFGSVNVDLGGLVKVKHFQLGQIN